MDDLLSLQLVGSNMESSNINKTKGSTGTGTGSSEEGKCDGNPFARGGLLRSPQSKAPNTGSADGSTRATELAALDGPGLVRYAEKDRKEMSRIAAAGQILDAIVDFTSTRSNISKDLKTSLLILRRVVQAAKRDAEATQGKSEASEGKKWAEKAQQTDYFRFTDVVKAHPSSDEPKPAIKRARQQARQQLLAKRRVTSPAKPATLRQATQDKVGRSVTTAPLSEAWTTVVKKAKAKPNPRPVEKPQQPKKATSKGDALVLKTDGSYAEALKKMRSDEKLAGLGADVRRIRRTRAGDMILELRRGSDAKGPAYKKLAEEVLGEGVTVRALTSEVTLQCKNLDEITEAGDVVDALRNQCKIEVDAKAVRLRNGLPGTQIATARLPVAEANKAMKVGKLKVGWSVCSLSIYQPPEACFRCLERGHKSWACKGPDRSKLCRRCGKEGHKAQGCNEAPRCMLCPEKSGNNHILGGPRCTATKGSRDKKTQ